MTATRTEARDDCMGLINTALNGHDVLIHWPGNVERKPASNEVWIRVSMSHVLSAQSALGKDQDGNRCYTHTGMLTAEVFTPMGDGLSQDDALAIVLRNAMKAARTPHGVILRNATAREAGADGGWHRTVVSADFEYDEVS